MCNSCLRSLSFILLCSSLLLISGCDFNQLNSSDAGVAANPGTAGSLPSSFSLGGSASLGTIVNGSATLSNVYPDGSSATPPLEVVTTDANGFSFATKPTGAFRICVSGGTYTDEATGDQGVDNTLTLCAISEDPTQRIAVSPISTFIDNIATASLQKMTGPTAADVTAQLAAARTLVQNFFGFQGDPTVAEPLFTPPDSVADPNGDRYKAAIILGAFSQQEKDYLAKCSNQQGERHELLKALFQDIKDNVFDGRGFDVNGQLQALLTKCNGVDTILPVATGSADLLAALNKFSQTAEGQFLDVGNHGATTAAITQAVATGDLAPTQIKVAPSQGLIAIDAKNNYAYVPIYTLDNNNAGDAQVAVVDLTVGVANPVLKVLSLPGSIRPVAATIDPTANRAYVEAATSSNNVNVYEIDTTTQTVIHTIAATGVIHSGSFGGIIANPGKHKLIIAGTNNIGMMDLSTDPPTMIANSVLSTGGTDSIALNFDTEVLFISSDGSMSAVDTAVTPPVQYSVGMSLGTTDGVAFDTLTNLLVVDPEFQDLSYVLNFNGATLANAMTLPYIEVDGYGTSGPVGEGPGGQAVMNVITHQAVVADEFGQNFRLMQLPSGPITGAPNNNGQSGSGTTADASSAYTIASAVLPMPDVNGTPTQLGILGDPNSLTMDPSRNYVYTLADTTASYHTWTPGSTTPLFLIRIDLSAPLFGTSPTVTDGSGNKWEPTTWSIRMP